MILALCLCLLALLGVLLYGPMLWRRLFLPPGPFPAPFFGNLLAFDPKSPQKVLDKWVKEYGPVYTVWMANEPAVVIADYDLVKDALTKHGDQLSGRLRNFSYVYAHKNTGIVFATGDLWQEQRRFSLHVLRNFGLGRNIMQERIMVEAKKLSADWIDECKATKDGQSFVFDPTEPLHVLIGNIISSIVVGHTFDKSQQHRLTYIREVIQRQFVLLSSLHARLLNSYPWLRHLRRLPFCDGFSIDKLIETDMEAVKFMEVELGALKERMRKEDRDLTDEDVEPTCFCEAYLQEIQRRKAKEEDLSHFSEDQLMALMGDFFTAGTETTATTLRWTLLSLVLHPEAQQRAFEQIKSVIGLDKEPDLADRQILPLVMATLHEVQRWGNIVAINLSHTSDREFLVGGFRVPANVEVIPQVSAMNVDRSVFPEPEKFRPERFLGEDGKTVINADRIAPFSMGKRKCAGESLARAELFLVFVHLLQRFEFSLPPGADTPDLDPCIAITAFPKPYDVMVKLRSHML